MGCNRQVLKSLDCIHQVSLPLHLPPLLHVVSSQLGPQNTKEGYRVEKPRMMRRDLLNWLASDVLDPLVIGKDNEGNRHEHDLEHANGSKCTR